MMNTISDIRDWLKEHGTEMVSTLQACDQDDEVRNVGLDMLEILKAVFFERGTRHWFRHDLELFYRAERLGIHFLPTHFYSTLPTSCQLGENHWRQYRTPGIRWRSDDQWRTLEQDLRSVIAEFQRTAKDGSMGALLAEAPFNPGDLALYYALIRHRKPEHVIEVGSGASSHVALDALRRNGAGQLTCIEPYPSPCARALGNEVALHEVRVQDLLPEFFTILGPRDILFIDSTHVAVVGSDVNHLVLQILPTLAPGVAVHFHDIMLPSEIPASWVKENALFWNEQHLLQAFLAFNGAFQVLISSPYLEQSDPVRYQQIVESGGRSGSLWIERRHPNL